VRQLDWRRRRDVDRDKRTLRVLSVGGEQVRDDVAREAAFAVGSR
jgi:hypothetical protein